MKTWIFAFTFAVTTVSFAQTDSEPATPPAAVTAPTEKSFEFNKIADEKKAAKNPQARLKFSEKKEGVFLEFEGHRLAKGAYILAKLPNCDKKTFKSLPEGAELMNFETTYGDISSENTLANQTLASLELEKNKIALIKKNKKKPVLLYCGE